MELILVKAIIRATYYEWYEAVNNKRYDELMACKELDVDIIGDVKILEKTLEEEGYVS